MAVCFPSAVDVGIIPGMKKIKTSWLILILAFLMIGLGPASGKEESEKGDLHYSLGRIEGSMAIIDLLGYDSPDQAPDSIRDIGLTLPEMMEQPFRNDVDLDTVADFVPQWALGDVVLATAGGRIVARATSGFVELNICGQNLIVGLVFPVPDEWAVEANSLYGDESGEGLSRIEWAVLIGPASGKESEVVTSPVIPDEVPPDEISEVIAQRFEDYSNQFVDNTPEWLEVDTDSYQSWWSAIPGDFACGEEDGEDVGQCWAVFYCMRMWEYAAGVVEIVDETGALRILLEPGNGLPDPDVYYQAEPLGVCDVDGDGWDELIVLKGFYEGFVRAIWDPTPSGAIELAESFYRGC